MKNKYINEDFAFKCKKKEIAECFKKMNAEYRHYKPYVNERMRYLYLEAREIAGNDEFLIDYFNKRKRILAFSIRF